MHSFTLDEDAILAGPDVLVLVPAGALPAGLKHDDRVLVTGTVRKYVTKLEEVLVIRTSAPLAPPPTSGPQARRGVEPAP